MDAAWHKEVVLKVCVQPWIDEAFTIIVAIEGKLIQMQGHRHRCIEAVLTPRSRNSVYTRSSRKQLSALLTLQQFKQSWTDSA